MSSCSAICCSFLAIAALAQSSGAKGSNRDAQGAQQEGQVKTQKSNAAVTVVDKKLEEAANYMHAQPPDYDRAIATLIDTTQRDPDQDVVWYRLGIAYLESAKAQSDAAEQTKRNVEACTAITQAIRVYQRKGDGKLRQGQGSSNPGGGLDMSRLMSQPARVTGAPELPKAEVRLDPRKLAVYYDRLGDAASNLGKKDQAQKDFEQAAQLDPANAATYYFNLGIILRNSATTVQDRKEAVDAFDKAIAADPNKAAAYYLKGEMLFGMSTTDEAGKVVSPPGTVEALQKYLELQPNNSYAEQAKSILASLNVTVDSSATNKATSKKK